MGRDWFRTQISSEAFSKLALKKGSRAQRENLIMSEIQGEKRRSTKETHADHSIVISDDNFQSITIASKSSILPNLSMPAIS